MSVEKIKIWDLGTRRVFERRFSSKVMHGRAHHATLLHRLTQPSISFGGSATKKIFVLGFFV
jgi:hypothetical protein